MDSMLPPGNSIRVCVHEGETVSVTPRGGGVGVLWMIFVCPWQLCVFVSKVRQLLGGHWECVCSCCVFVCRCLRILSDLVLIHVSPAIRRSSVTSPFSSRWRHQTLLHFPTQPFVFFLVASSIRPYESLIQSTSGKKKRQNNRVQSWLSCRCS